MRLVTSVLLGGSPIADVWTDGYSIYIDGEKKDAVSALLSKIGTYTVSINGRKRSIGTNDPVDYVSYLYLALVNPPVSAMQVRLVEDDVSLGDIAGPVESPYSGMWRF